MTAIARKSNLSHQVTQELGKAIVCGDFDADSSFPTEAELCEQFGVSRTAVREAVKMLSAKGLVSSKPRQGIRIMPEEDWNILDSDLLKWSLESQPSRSVLKEFFQLRLAIEPEAAALAARFSHPEHLRAISDVLDRMREAPAHSEPARQADVDFHLAILYATENRFYIRLRDFIRTALDISIRYTEVGEVDHNATIDTHGKVYRAIKSGDPEQARHAMRWLIDDALVFIESGPGSAGTYGEQS